MSEDIPAIETPGGNDPKDQKISELEAEKERLISALKYLMSGLNSISATVEMTKSIRI